MDFEEIIAGFISEEWIEGRLSFINGEKAFVKRRIKAKWSSSRRETIPPSIRREVLERDEHTCANVPCPNEATHVHHIVPVSRGGSNHPDNLISLCKECHRKVHSRSNWY